MATLRTSIGTSHARRLKSPTVAEEEQPEDVPDPDDLYPKPQSVTPGVADAPSVSRSIASVPSSHGRRAGYTAEAETAIHTLFREYLNRGNILTAEIRMMRNAYPQLNQHLITFSDAQLKDKVRSLIQKRAKPAKK